MKDQAWIADLLAGYRTIQVNGNPIKKRNILNLTGNWSFYDDPVGLASVFGAPLDGIPSQEYGGTGNKIYVPGTETKMGVTPSTDGGPVLDSFVTELTGSGIVAAWGVHGQGTSPSGKAACDVSISVLGLDTGFSGDWWRGDLIFTVYFNAGATLYNAAGSQSTITAQGVRKNGTNGAAYAATATVSGNQVHINVSGTPSGASPIKWQCIGQLQWIQ